ncbi:MAG TPA: TRAM domain-containing protein [Methanosarcinales archaeon]|nr:TRAM domain-containing protein [Methanosarcinales archaeon]
MKFWNKVGFQDYALSNLDKKKVYNLFNFKRKSKAPVSVGEIYNVKIEDIARQGDGIARIQGFVIFVPNTKVGDDVRIRINNVARKFAFADIVD